MVSQISEWYIYFENDVILFETEKMGIKNKYGAVAMPENKV